MLTKYNPKINYSKLCSKYHRLTNIILHSSPKNYTKEIITFTKKQMVDFSFCGAINGYFVANIDAYLEGLNHNSCLHKKIAIDKEGNIKNCPSMTEVFGNIKNIKLEEVLQNKDFKKY